MLVYSPAIKILILPLLYFWLTLGIAVGHIYFFLEDVFPNQPGGIRILKTPSILWVFKPGCVFFAGKLGRGPWSSVRSVNICGLSSLPACLPWGSTGIGRNRQCRGCGGSEVHRLRMCWGWLVHRSPGWPLAPPAAGRSPPVLRKLLSLEGWGSKMGKTDQRKVFNGGIKRVVQVSSRREIALG